MRYRVNMVYNVWQHGICYIVCIVRCRSISLRILQTMVSRIPLVLRLRGRMYDDYVLCGLLSRL